MSVFKRRRFPAEIILPRVRWYCKYGVSYRDLDGIWAERWVDVDYWIRQHEIDQASLPLQNGE